MSLNNLWCTGQHHRKELPSPKISSAEAENPWPGSETGQDLFSGLCFHFPFILGFCKQVRSELHASFLVIGV